MNTHIARRVARCMALPVVAAGIIGGAGPGPGQHGQWPPRALGRYDPQVRSGIVAEPKTKAEPPAEAYPGALVAPA